MSGYEWHPIFRQVPVNGAEVTTDTRLAFADASGPTKVDVRWPPDRRRRQDVNENLRGFVRGFRMEARLTLEILDMDHHQHLVDVVNRLSRTDWTTYLSLDAGTNETEVELADYRGPRPLGGKTFVGGMFELRVLSKELVPEVPLIVATTPQPLPVAPVVSLPPPSAAFRGRIFFVPGIVGVREDVSYQCLQGYNGQYDWIPLAAGGV